MIGYFINSILITIAILALGLSCVLMFVKNTYLRFERNGVGKRAKVNFTLEQAKNTRRLDGVVGQRYSTAALFPGKTKYPFYRRLDRPQGWSGRVRKITPSPAFDPRTVRPVASCCTDCAGPVQLEGSEHVK
jgi:hypothetical protein